MFGNKEGEFRIGDFNGDDKSDLAFFEPGPRSSTMPYYTRIYVRLTLNQVNGLVSFSSMPKTKTTRNTTGCPVGYKGKFSFEALLKNTTSNKSLSDLTVVVKELGNENLVANADYGPGGKGSIVTVPQKDGYSDGSLTPWNSKNNEFVCVPFTICLKKFAPFRFYVDVLGETTIIKQDP